MSIARQLTPIRIGFLMDFVLPPPSAWNALRDMVDAIELTFGEATRGGQLDRPVELVVREVEGLPRGTVKAVIDAYAGLVDAGCLAVIGPMISENAVPVRAEIERRFLVPSLSICGSDDWHGEWTFSLSNGSLTDEPYVIANLCARAGHRRVAVLVERSLIGPQYLEFFRQACRFEGLGLVAETWIPQSGFDASRAIAELAGLEPEALVHLGFGLGAVGINDALRATGWNPPRYMGTAWENGFMSDEIFETHRGWIGLEQYDETNPVGQALLDRFEKAHGRRPGYYAPLIGHDVANALAHALAGAQPLSPRGVMQALERVKMLPAASGSPGTRISFGKWTRRGWMGAGYLVAREVAPDLKSTVFRGRYGQD